MADKHRRRGKSWFHGDLPNWRDRVEELTRGEQIIVRREQGWNSIYIAAKRKGIRVIRTKISDSEFAIAAEGRYDLKLKNIQSGKIYYTRAKEKDLLLDSA
jgi:hypothetical protein